MFNQIKLKQGSFHLISALLVSGIFVFSLCATYEPKWETNDDVSMSMFAHGYGGAAIGTPNLLFSNVIWGYFVRTIPMINGVLGYSIATLLILASIATIICYVLRKLEFNWFMTLCVLTLVLIRPILFPQFTVNAGLLMVTAVMCWFLYALSGNRFQLLTGCLLAYFSYIVRSHEFLLVLLIASPLLPWKKLLQAREAQLAVLILVCMIGVSYFIDYQAYQGNDWIAYNALNPLRAMFTDFGAGVYFKQSPELLAQYGYSGNDIDLLTNFFFVDPKIANPELLKAMLHKIGPIVTQAHALSNGWVGVKSLAHPVLLPVVLIALYFMVVDPSRKLFAAWGLAIITFFIMGLQGRPGVLRVYVPVVALLMLAPFILSDIKHRVENKLRWRFAHVIIFIAALISTIQVCSESNRVEMASKQTRHLLQDFPNSPIVLWGASFPFEEIYPVLQQSNFTRAYKLYGLGVSTLAPFSRAYTEQKNGHGFVEQLVSPAGVPVVALELYFDLLTTYCRERLGGVLQELSSHQYGSVNISVRQCHIDAPFHRNRKPLA